MFSEDERVLVSCQPLSSLFEAFEREGRETSALLAGVQATREQLLDRHHRVHWDEFRRVLENATRDWSEEQVIAVGRGVVHSRAQRPFALIARHLFTVADFYRAVFCPRTGYGPAMFPCIDPTFVQLGEDTFEATLTLHEGLTECPALFVITKGNVMGIPEVLGSPAATVHMELYERGARYEIHAPHRPRALARIRRRIGLPFHAREVATELQEAHASLRSRFERLQEALHEREQTEQALRHSEERHRLLVENMVDPLFVLEAGGRVVDVNESACKSLDYPRSSLVGMPLSGFAVDWDEQRFVAATSSLQERVPATFEGSHQRADGTTIPVEVRLTRVRSAEGESLFYAAARDVSERRQAQEERERHAMQLMRSQRLEALGTLAGGIMHDFNNLLHAINGHTEMALDSAEEEPEIRTHLEHVLQACQRGEQIARQILTFSRDSKHDPSPTEVAEVVREGLELMRATLPATVELRSKLGAERAMVMADAGQLQQVLMNLCTNAAHAMEPEGGPLEVELETATLSAAERERFPGLSAETCVRLSVRDHGTGIPAESLERIFDPFFSTKAPERGTGLGLAVVHGIVQAHEGAIDVVTSPGEGTCVHVLLPSHEGAGTSVEHAPRSAHAHSGRILAVDDDPEVATLLEARLRRLGYVVEVFTEGPRAIERFAQEPQAFDLVITDQSMPTVTGLHLGEQIRKLRPGIPVVLISGMGTPADREQIERAGIVRVLRKPFNTQELSEALAESFAAV